MSNVPILTIDLTSNRQSPYRYFKVKMPSKVKKKILKLKESSTLVINEKSKKLNVIDGSIQSKEREIPEYIQYDGKSKSVKLVRIPKFSEIPYPTIMEPNLVIEYYSR